MPKISLSKHTQAILGVVFITFLSNYITTPSVSHFLSVHTWLADIVGSCWAAYHVYQTYSGQSTNPQKPVEPALEQK